MTSCRSARLARLGQQPNIKTQAFVIQQSSFLILNMTIKPLDDKNIRQALNYALDKDAILKAVYFGQAKFMNSPIPPGTYYDKTLPGYPFNLDKAKQLMAASSMPNGFTIDFTIASGNNTAQQTRHDRQGPVVQDRRHGQHPVAGGQRPAYGVSGRDRETGDHFQRAGRTT